MHVCTKRGRCGFGFLISKRRIRRSPHRLKIIYTTVASSEKTVNIPQAGIVQPGTSHPQACPHRAHPIFYNTSKQIQCTQIFFAGVVNLLFFWFSMRTKLYFSFKWLEASVVLLISRQRDASILQGPV